ncbi:MAG TPA: hypothetical protein PLN31_19180, partial [Azoarcus taiwanensis]|nr:hypothetical protein [Azoarcus taiwanensis]
RSEPRRSLEDRGYLGMLLIAISGHGGSVAWPQARGEDESGIMRALFFGSPGSLPDPAWTFV